MKNIVTLSCLTATLLLTTSFTSNKPDNEQTWKLAKEQKDIKISYRNVPLKNSQETREIKITFRVNATQEELLNHFKRSEKFSKWAAGIKYCQNVSEQDTCWTMYGMYDVPWPFEQRDIVTEYQVHKIQNDTKLVLISKPHLVQNQEGVKRIEKYDGSWYFKQLDDDQIEVTFRSISYTAPVVPRFIMDPILQGVFINSIQKLKLQLASRK